MWILTSKDWNIHSVSATLKRQPNFAEHASQLPMHMLRQAQAQVLNRIKTDCHSLLIIMLLNIDPGQQMKFLSGKSLFSIPVCKQKQVLSWCMGTYPWWSSFVGSAKATGTAYWESDPSGFSLLGTSLSHIRYCIHISKLIWLL
ncbi:hypothetical protein V6N13_052590 [Hibiscus sabdariffa]|uniref:Uncharacterized protein n=2 Tax=Hibiscus sabdariffa TaxID=183260 RepID=A0ABR2Q4T1_9ROSI